MTLIKSILSIVLFFVGVNTFAQFNRVSKPYKYELIFADNETIILHVPADSLIGSFYRDSVYPKKQLIKAIVWFKYEEKLLFEYDSSRLTKMAISHRKKEIVVTKNLSIENISAIYFNTSVLKWRGKGRRAFNADRFLIKFNIENEENCKGGKPWSLEFWLPAMNALRIMNRTTQPIQFIEPTEKTQGNESPFMQNRRKSNMLDK